MKAWLLDVIGKIHINRLIVLRKVDFTDIYFTAVTYADDVFVYSMSDFVLFCPRLMLLSVLQTFANYVTV